MTLRFDPRVMLLGEIGCQSLLGVKRLKKCIYIITFLALELKILTLNLPLYITSRSWLRNHMVSGSQAGLSCVSNKCVSGSALWV